ncbi:MAG: hypothetical protein V7K24_10640 [Nostoc sp.]
MRIKVEARFIAIKKIVNAIALGNKNFRMSDRFLMKIKKITY